MARSFFNANMLSAVADSVSLSIARRYSATSQGLASRVGRGGISGVVKSGEEKLKMGIKDGAVESSWVPDPVTGYYRPANGASEIDPVELRQMLLNHKHETMD